MERGSHSPDATAVDALCYAFVRDDLQYIVVQKWLQYYDVTLSQGNQFTYSLKRDPVDGDRLHHLLWY